MKAILGILTCLISFGVIAQERAFDTLFYQYEFEDRVYIEGLTVNNVRVGEWTYTPNDSFKIVGSYKDGKVHGPWYYIENHDTNSILNFKHGVYHGQQTGFFNYPKGNVLAGIENFVDGYRHGLEIKYYPTGQIYDQLYYEYGKPTGVHTRYKLDGSIRGKIIYENCSFAHFHSIIDSNKTFVIREHKVADTDTTLLCIYQLKNEQRVKVMDLEYVNQRPNGLLKYYNDQGQVVAISRFKDGEIIKRFTFFTYKKGKRKISRGKNYPVIKFIPISRYFHQYPPFFNDPSFDQRADELNRFLNSYREEIAKKSYMVNGILIYYTYQLNQFGEIINVRVQETSDPAFDQYLTDLIYRAPNQQPHNIHGIPVVSPVIRGAINVKTIR